MGASREDLLELYRERTGRTTISPKSLPDNHKLLGYYSDHKDDTRYDD